ncbi:MAG: glycosyltransferase family 2 protein [Desulfobacterales bacterium]
MNKLPLSVSIITLNEEHNLERCLQSIAGLAAEIVVIDSGSTDQTGAIARRYGAFFEYNKWPGHVAQKNYALSRCSQPWVLSLDADEALDPVLQTAIRKKFAAGQPLADGYWLNRKTFYLNDWIRYAWYPEWRLRLVRKELAGWEGRDPHDHMKTPAKTDQLKGHLLHYSYNDLQDHLMTTIKYARMGAAAAIEKGDSFQWHKLLLSPGFRFFKSLVVKQAWRDGWRGWIIAFTSMFSCFAKYAFIYEFQRARKQKDSTQPLL